MPFEPYVRINIVLAAYWEKTAHLVCDMFSECKYLLVSLMLPPRFWSGNFFLAAPFPDHAYLYLFFYNQY